MYRSASIGFFEFVIIVLENHSYGIYVVDLLERHFLCLHLVEDGVCAFHSGLYLIFESCGIEFLFHGTHEFFHNLFAMILGLAELRHYPVVSLRMLVFESEVLKFSLYLEQSEPVSERSINV